MSWVFPDITTDPGDDGEARFTKIKAAGDGLWKHGAAPWLVAAGGSTANYVVVTWPAGNVLPAYVAGAEFNLVVGISSTTSVVMNHGSLGDIDLKDGDGNALTSTNRLIAGRAYRCKIWSASEIRVVAGLAIASGSSAEPPHVAFAFEKAQNVGGGTLMANTDTTIAYNTTVSNGRSDVSLNAANGVISLPPGIPIRYQSWQAIHNTGQTRIRLKANIGGAEISGTKGLPVRTTAGGLLVGFGRFQLAAATDVRVDARGDSTQTTTGLGYPANVAGVAETYGGITFDFED
jgi:hypothetical protein